MHRIYDYKLCYCLNRKQSLLHEVLEGTSSLINKIICSQPYIKILQKKFLVFGGSTTNKIVHNYGATIFSILLYNIWHIV